MDDQLSRSLNWMLEKEQQPLFLNLRREEILAGRRFSLALEMLINIFNEVNLRKLVYF